MGDFRALPPPDIAIPLPKRYVCLRGATSMSNETHFGFEAVAPGEKQARVDDVFRKVRDDFTARSVAISDAELRGKIDGYLVEAVKQLESGV